MGLKFKIDGQEQDTPHVRDNSDVVKENQLLKAKLEAIKRLLEE
jgi:hypothetical protein